MKKVRIIMSLAIIAAAGITLNSCQKSATDSETLTDDNSPQSVTLSKYNKEAMEHAIAAYVQSQQEKGLLKSGAEFIQPFFTSDGFGIGQDIQFEIIDGWWYIVGGEIGFFSSDLDANDFYRENPDGTVSVHINSNTALGDYFNFNPGGGYAWGENGHLSMKYTGPVVTFTYEWEGVTYTYTFIDIYSNPNAVVMHGSGKVQYDGTGPKHNLVVHLSADPGWENVNTYININ
jgi:hypothetical protein